MTEGSGMQRSVLMVIGAALAGILAIWFLAFARPYTFRGSQIEPPVPAAPIELKRADGSVYRLSESIGKVTLVFFGYTTCPDFCPATLADMKRIKTELGEAASKVNFIFITVDPQRDTPERTQSYASGFDPQFIGLSGSEADLEPVWKGYWVYREIQHGQSAVGYLVDHSTRIYLIDPAGDLRLTFAYGTSPVDIAADVRYVLKER
jgi:protein SCO1/2